MRTRFSNAVILHRLMSPVCWEVDISFRYGEVQLVWQLIISLVSDCGLARLRLFWGFYPWLFFPALSQCNPKVDLHRPALGSSRGRWKRLLPGSRRHRGAHRASDSRNGPVYFWGTQIDQLWGFPRSQKWFGQLRDLIASHLCRDFVQKWSDYERNWT